MFWENFVFYDYLIEQVMLKQYFGALFFHIILREKIHS